jgi:NADH dehydrogenase FAD-containing subunit
MALSGATLSTTLYAPAVLGQAKAKVVVVGGGPGGGTAARYVHKDAAGAIEVTLVEPQRNFTTCFFSNLHVGGFRNFESITHNYNNIRKGGMRVVAESATAIDRDKKQVVLASGGRLPYDRLVVAPGIDLKFDSVPDYSEKAAQIMPHAWKAGAQTQLLVRKLNALKDGDVIVMVAPPNPYRCPPGPYERICMFAHVLKTKGHKKSKIVVLDTKPAFSKQALFMEGWEKHYPGMIEWLDPKMHGGITGLDPRSGEIRTGLGTYKAALANVIPAQFAGRIARDAGLADQTGFCPIDPESMKSKQDNTIFVVGDACIPGDMPKSAFSANSQAKVAAMTIRGELTGSRVFPARYSNTCWSLIAPDDNVFVGGGYEPGDGKIKQTSTTISQKGENADTRKQNYQASIGWYAGIVSDVFG